MKRKFLDIIKSIILGVVSLLIIFTVGITILSIVCILLLSIQTYCNVDLEPILTYIADFLIILAIIYAVYDIGNDLL